MEAIAFVDGRGNAGDEGAAACVILVNGEVVCEASRPLGAVTNNVAEYQGVALALRHAARIGVKRLKVFSDSQLIVRQIKGEYVIREESLRPLRDRVYTLAVEFESVEIEWVPREQNKRADFLCREANKPMAARPSPRRQGSSI